MAENKNKNMRDNNREGTGVLFLYLLYTAISIVVIIQIVCLQLNFKNSDDYLKYYRTSSRKSVLDPVRGSIISDDGRLLAVSIPMYQVYMDCAVRRTEFELLKDKERKRDAERERKGLKRDDRPSVADSLERTWRAGAKELSKGLAAIYGGKSADGWYNDIISGRVNNKRHFRIGGKIDHETLRKVKALPLFREGQNLGGIIVEQMDTRQYPYGSLALRTIGYVKDNHDSKGTRYIGLEGSYDYYLHGREGYKWMRPTDKIRIQDKDSTWARAEDGQDIRTTLNVDIQDIADHALRSQIADNMKIEGGCVVVMDVGTGAIKAMVNLQRDSVSGRVTESYNMAIARAGEPGSVFKTAILMSLMEDGKVKLSDEVPTNHGVVPGFKPDYHISDYERSTGRKTMSVMHGYQISSNYIFRHLAIENYGSKPKKLLDNLYLYKLGEAFDFDLKGFTAPVLPSPDSKYWSKTDLGSIAIGYSVSETPLHILNFYNAIANKGRMMRPYLVESIESNGIVRTKKGPSVLNGAICSKSVADSLTKGLMSITEEGTAKRLKGARCKVAGKTGTARIVLDPKYTRKSRNPYEDELGRKQYQATFVGFFPAEAPRYSAIVVIYSNLNREIFYGGTTPAMVYRELVDKIYALDESYGESYDTKGPLPNMSGSAPATAKNGKVPNLKGLGLMDAVYAIENDGYVCQYSGCGHVVSQTPAAGASFADGGTVTIKLN